MHRGKTNEHRVLVGKPEGRRPLGRRRHRRVDNIKMDLSVVWSGLNWLRVGNLRTRCESMGSIKCWEIF
jgi:hypothetical protein